jgi:hypothetical protein
LLLLPATIAALALTGAACAQQAPNPQSESTQRGAESTASQTGAVPSLSREGHERILGVIPAFWPDINRKLFHKCRKT